MLIVSFTTIPERLNIGLPAILLNNILQQTRKPDCILVNIPEVSRKGVVYDKGKAEELAKLDPSVTLNWVSTDYGPITKLMGALEYIDAHGLHGAQICLVDDDCAYIPSMIGDLLVVKEEKKLCAVGYSGRTLVIQDGKFVDAVFNGLEKAVIFTDLQYSFDFYDSGTKDALMKTSFLETYAGAVYNADMFLPLNEFKDWYGGLSKEVISADDIVIGAWINKKGCRPSLVRAKQLTVNTNEKGTPSLVMENVFHDTNTKVCKYFIENGYYKEAYYETEYTWFAWIKYYQKRFCITLLAFIVLCILLLWKLCSYLFRETKGTKRSSVQGRKRR